MDKLQVPEAKSPQLIVFCVSKSQASAAALGPQLACHRA